MMGERLSVGCDVLVMSLTFTVHMLTFVVYQVVVKYREAGVHGYLNQKL